MMSFLFLIILLLFAIMIVYIPITIADIRGISAGNRTTIALLSWLGLILGITWFIALILSLVWRGGANLGVNNLDKLESLSRLYKEKAITKAEFEKMKKKLMS